MKRVNANSLMTKDFPASIVVFLVALPLCMGVALASDANVISGLIAGMVGGIVVGLISNSHTSVSGPAAGLTVIVAGAIATLGSFELFLAAMVIAGLFQLALGVFKLGILAQYVPNSVIKGMLAAIGLILILKQIPHAFGYDANASGDFAFIQKDNQNTFSELFHMLQFVSPGAIVISLLSLAILFLWDKPFFKKIPLLKTIPGALVVVLLGVGLNFLFSRFLPSFYLSKEHLVNIPDFGSPTGFFTSLTHPDFSGLFSNMNVWIVAVQLAVVASLESLLSIEATDKLDPHNRITSPNRELIAQGSGNVLAGLIGGIPVTAVIVRSSANINSGGVSKFSAIMHGAWLLLAVLFLGKYLNFVPFASLAAILITVGYKLTKPSLFKEQKEKGMNSLIPFVVTIVAIMFSDLLVGVLIGIITGVIFVMKSNQKNAYTLIRESNKWTFLFNKDIVFTNKAALKSDLLKVQPGTSIVFDTSKIDFMDEDVKELLVEYIESTPDQDVQVKIIGDKLKLD